MWFAAVGLTPSRFNFEITRPNTSTSWSATSETPKEKQWTLKRRIEWIKILTLIRKIVLSNHSLIDIWIIKVMILNLIILFVNICHSCCRFMLEINTVRIQDQDTTSSHILPDNLWYTSLDNSTPVYLRVCNETCFSRLSLIWQLFFGCVNNITFTFRAF